MRYTTLYGQFSFRGVWNPASNNQSPSALNLLIGPLRPNLINVLLSYFILLLFLGIHTQKDHRIGLASSWLTDWLDLSDRVWFQRTFPPLASLGPKNPVIRYWIKIKLNDWRPVRSSLIACVGWKKPIDCLMLATCFSYWELPCVHLTSQLREPITEGKRPMKRSRKLIIMLC